MSAGIRYPNPISREAFLEWLREQPDAVRDYVALHVGDLFWNAELEKPKQPPNGGAPPA